MILIINITGGYGFGNNNIIIATADVLIATQVTKKTQSNIIPTKIHTQKFFRSLF